MSDWQPIETAPAIGKRRLLFITAKKLQVVGYRVAGSRRCVATGYGSLPVTHWQPLPAPPTDREEN